MKKIKALLLAVVIAGTILPLQAFGSTAVVAKRGTSTVFVNDKQVSVSAYNIGGNNYFKLRDMAQAISGTDKQFNITWDGAKNAISMQSGVNYVPVGGEMQQTVAGDKTAVKSSSKLYLNDTEIALAAYNIGGNNYFKLRDVMEVFNIQTTFVEAQNAIQLNTKGNYSAEVTETKPENPSDKLTTEQIAAKAVSVVQIETTTPTGGKLGSGFILTEDGKIATNQHVIENATAIWVYLDDGTKLSVPWVLYNNEARDIAIIQVETTQKLPAVTLGDSETLRLGADLVVISSPIGLANTVSTGIYSKKLTPDVRSKQGYDIQMTVPISSGSSGGAVFDNMGRVVGMAYAGFEGGQNLNLAIPVSEIKQGMASYNKISMTQFSQGGKTSSITPLELSIEMTNTFGSFVYGSASYERAIMDYILVMPSTKEADLLVVGILVEDWENISALESAYYSGGYKSAFDSYCRSIINYVLKYYPEKRILGYWCTRAYSSSKPLTSGYDDVYFDEDESMWCAQDDLVYFEYEKGKTTIEFDQMHDFAA